MGARLTLSLLVLDSLFYVRGTGIKDKLRHVKSKYKFLKLSIALQEVHRKREIIVDDYGSDFL